MTTTAGPASAQGVLPIGAQVDGGASTHGAEDDVLSQDAVGTLSVLVAEQAREDAAAARKMRAVTQSAGLPRVAVHEFLLNGPIDRDLAEALEERPAMGLEGVLRLAGEGAFMVSEF